MEIRTLIELVKGKHAGEIANELKLKQTTIESYLINIKNKLAVNNKSELIQLTLREEILQQVII
jgi:DNA-binding NarL/FixJ family response regulator